VTGRLVQDEDHVLVWVASYFAPHFAGRPATHHGARRDRLAGAAVSPPARLAAPNTDSPEAGIQCTLGALAVAAALVVALEASTARLRDDSTATRFARNTSRSTNSERQCDRCVSCGRRNAIAGCAAWGARYAR
jgi:hypothetical protein